MGFKTEFNWVLKLKSGVGLESILNQIKARDSEEAPLLFDFDKAGNRVYPIGLPIDLLNENWEALAKVVVVSAENSGERTTGKYKVLKIYEGREKQVLTDYWQENSKILKRLGAVS